MLRIIFFLIIRFIVLVIIGLNVRRKTLLPKHGPAIIIANHNSHLDTLVLQSLFPLKQLKHIKPVAAADYFTKNKLFSWFSTQIIGIVPITRNGKDRDPLKPCRDALDKGEILILYPEGTRGEPENLSQFKKGVAHLAMAYPAVPIIPVFIHGLGKCLPKGDFVPVPFFCDIFIGQALPQTDDREVFMNNLNTKFKELAAEGNFAEWN